MEQIIKINKTNKKKTKKKTIYLCIEQYKRLEQKKHCKQQFINNPDK